MRKNISTQELKTQIGEVVDAVRLRGDRYVIKRRGKPVAALVPLSINEAYERNRRELFSLMDTVAERNRDLPSEQIDAAINQAIREVRLAETRKAFAVMIRAVLDTNVLISSFLQAASIPGEIRRAWQENRFELCLSKLLFAELHDVLSRPVIARNSRVRQTEINEFLERMAKAAVFVPEPLTILPVISQDPDDDVVLATALAAQASFIVSGDQHLLQLEEYQGISIVTARRFLEIL